LVEIGLVIVEKIQMLKMSQMNRRIEGVQKSSGELKDKKTNKNTLAFF
jgi:hypothetical protein